MPKHHKATTCSQEINTACKHFAINQLACCSTPACCWVCATCYFLYYTYIYYIYILIINIYISIWSDKKLAPDFGFPRQKKLTKNGTWVTKYSKKQICSTLYLHKISKQLMCSKFLYFLITLKSRNQELLTTALQWEGQWYYLEI